MRFCDSGEWRITDKLLYSLDGEMVDKMSAITLQTRDHVTPTGPGPSPDDTCTTDQCNNVLQLSNIVDKMELTDK